MNPYMFRIAIAVSLLMTTPAFAQSAESPIPPDDAAGIMNAIPPEVQQKLGKLSELIDQHIKAGKITEAQIQQQLASGRLEQTIRSLGPEANQLFDEIRADMKNGNGPGKDALLPLLRGLGGAGK